MPVEFSTGAYRLFHSRARGRYRLNPLTDGSSGNPRARLFDVGNDDEPILLGGSPLPDLLVVEWDRFFGPTAQVSRIMDMLYSRPIVRLPIGEAGSADEQIVVDCDPDDEPACPIDVEVPRVRDVVVANLALLDLLRSQTHKNPGGVALANYFGAPDDDCDEDQEEEDECQHPPRCPDVTVYSIKNMTEDNVFGLPANYIASDDVPLIWYLAHESIFEKNGTRLGNLGSRIVAEVVYGLIEESPVSISDGSAAFTSLITGTTDVSFLDLFQFIGWL
mmetsp:Transcript_23655/g.75941  ORF Transcript_23655/g.75941 Transcript_23655/m.75941 type:complete len:276 (-) Transcript_23655:2094-2921(-)